MTKTAFEIRFKATLFRPPAIAKVGSSTLLLTLPKKASAKLPSRDMTMVEGTINGFPFPRATFEPDGQGNHWLRVIRNMREPAGADAGDVVTVEIVPAGEEPEPRVPADLRQALAVAPKARRCGQPSRQSRAGIGSSGSRPLSGPRLARVGLTGPARCSPPESDEYVASTLTKREWSSSVFLSRDVVKMEKRAYPHQRHKGHALRVSQGFV